MGNDDLTGVLVPFYISISIASKILSKWTKNGSFHDQVLMEVFAVDFPHLIQNFINQDGFLSFGQKEVETNGKK